MDIIELVDTIIKIGLGGTISAVAGYFGGSAQHKNEKEKALINKKIEILEYATENIEPFIHGMHKFFSRIDGIHRRELNLDLTIEDDFETSEIQPLDSNLVATREKKSIAISRLKLAGFTGVTLQIQEMVNIETDFRQQVIFEKELPNKENLKEYSSKFKIQKNKFYEELEKAFNSLSI